MKLKSFRGIARISEDEYVDRYVEGYSRGEMKKPVVTKEVIYARYRCVGVFTGEAVEDGFKVPRHDALFVDPSDFTYHFLRRIK